MPCYDERNDAAYQVAQAHIDWVHNSPVAELLCGLLKRMSQFERDKYLPHDRALRQWWEDHQRRDAEKARRERRREAEEQERIKQQIADLQRKLKKPR